MYMLLFTNSFPPTYKTLIKGHKVYEKRTNKTLKLLKVDPLYPSLNSHKVDTRHFGKKWSSWISGDLRIIWDFDKEVKMRIFIFAIVTHSGSHKEYK